MSYYDELKAANKPQSLEMRATVQEMLVEACAEVERLRSQVASLQNKKTLTCVYCGKEYPPGTPTHGSDVLTAHIRFCEKHPMRALESEAAALRKERDMYAGFAANECVIQKVTDTLGQQTLTSSKRFHELEATEREVASLRATLENAADLAQEVDDLKAELDALRALVVKKDEALRVALGGTRRTTNDLNLNTVQHTADAALALTPADLGDCVVVKREEWGAVRAAENELIAVKKQMEGYPGDGEQPVSLRVMALRGWSDLQVMLRKSTEAQLAASEAALVEAKGDLAAIKITSEFWLAHEKAKNNEFEQQYLAIWKAAKKPDMTVLESVLAMKADLTAALAREAALRAQLTDESKKIRWPHSDREVSIESVEGDCENCCFSLGSINVVRYAVAVEIPDEWYVWWEDGSDRKRPDVQQLWGPFATKEEAEAKKAELANLAAQEAPKP